ncbi:MAG: hypothetical protein QGF90_11400 [Gammaproteobacteria bacterium]|nr:hypothetical protein [Gammaproteobacteria bacterium]
MTQIQQQFLSYLPPTLRNLMEGGSKRELLNKVDATLLAFDGKLVHIESGKIAEFQDSSAAMIDPDQLAQACSSILPEQQKDHSVLLLLPPEEFVATTQDMPGIGRDNLVSALKLQVDSLLPTFSDRLVLAVNPESADAGTGHTALWIANQRLMKFFDAFQAQNIFLVAIKPRLLNVTGENANCFVDEDRHSITAVKLSSHGIAGWWHLNKLDFEQEIFEQQWQQQIGEDSTAQLKQFSSAQDYLESSANQSNREYAFFPSGALNARHRAEQGWRILIAAGIVAVLLLLSAIPFIGQSLEFRSLAASLESQRELSIEARQDQAVVVNFENEWGPINDFPVQQVGEAMYTLQSVLSPNRLSSLEVSEGLVRIQGTSQEPQAILERLEQNPMFTEVVFSRATNNSRYYIDLRISTVNFEAYMVRYLPDE